MLKMSGEDAKEEVKKENGDIIVKEDEEIIVKVETEEEDEVSTDLDATGFLEHNLKEESESKQDDDAEVS